MGRRKRQAARRRSERRAAVPPATQEGVIVERADAKAGANSDSLVEVCATAPWTPPPGPGLPEVDLTSSADYGMTLQEHEQPTSNGGASAGDVGGSQIEARGHHDAGYGLIPSIAPPASPFSAEAERVWRSNFPPRSPPTSPPSPSRTNSGASGIPGSSRAQPPPSPAATAAAFQLALDAEEAFTFVADGFLTLRPQHISLGPDIASGAFARVRVGDFLGQRCAVKLQVVPSDAAEQANLLGELAVLRDLCHRCEHLVEYYGAAYLPPEDEDDDADDGGGRGEDGRFHFERSPSAGGAGRVMMVMELCERGALREALRQDLPWALRCRIISDVAEALKFLHGRGVLHRDVKTTNVLLEGGWRARLCDFNLAIADRSAAKLTYVAGTTEFMSPEMLLGENYSFPADMFSLGITLWETVTCREPAADFMARRPQDLFALDAAELELHRPRECPDSLWSLATDLTDPDADVRPGAAATVDWLADLLRDEYGGEVELPGAPVAAPGAATGLLPTTPTTVLSAADAAAAAGMAPADAGALRRSALRGREGKMVRGTRASFRRRTINSIRRTDFPRIRELAEGLAGRRKGRNRQRGAPSTARTGTGGEVPVLSPTAPSTPSELQPQGSLQLIFVTQLEALTPGSSGGGGGEDLRGDSGHSGHSVSLELRALADEDSVTPARGPQRRRRSLAGRGRRQLSPQKYQDAILHHFKELPGTGGYEEVRRSVGLLSRRVSQDSALVSRMQRVLERANVALREVTGTNGADADEDDQEEGPQGRAPGSRRSSSSSSSGELSKPFSPEAGESAGAVAAAAEVPLHLRPPPRISSSPAAAQGERIDSSVERLCCGVAKLAAAEAKVREVLEALSSDGRHSCFMRNYTGLCGAIADVLSRAQMAAGSCSRGPVAKDGGSIGTGVGATGNGGKCCEAGEQAEEGGSELRELRVTFVELLAEARILLRRHSAPDGF